MQHPLHLYNTLTRKKENFIPINVPFVGMYLCGPTVYNDAHIGNARPAIVFDVLYRYLTYLDYKVRYARNITDVGHLTGDADSGEDKIAQKAKLEKLEPMELVQKYTLKYHEIMHQLNVKRPTIEPTATGHIVEQIEITKKILEEGLAYESNESIYFDIAAYQNKYTYGELSGRITEELLTYTRELDGQNEKRNAADFALWKKASPEHIMRWPSPWGDGFPGWHLECTAMSTKYLGETFDIHGGGMDLTFPHHECEIAQNKAAFSGKTPAKFWVHNNMVTVNGQKMGKSLGNFITVEELLKGTHTLLRQAYSPMTVRFFILQAHYRSTLDFSDEALLAAQKAYKKLINAARILKNITYESPEVAQIDIKEEEEISNSLQACFEALNDDLNTAIVIANLFNLIKKINTFHTNPEKLFAISKELFLKLQTTFSYIVEEILGLIEEKPANFDMLISTILELYKDAKARKDYAKVDEIRANIKAIGVIFKDMKTGIEWAYEE